MKLKAARIFQDHMILQRGKAVWIFGEAEPGSEVTVSIQGFSAKTNTDKEGRFEMQLPPLAVSVSEQLQISSGDETLLYNDVAVGEVWLAGGQSNMEFQMFYDRDYEAVVSLSENPLIRMYDAPRIASEKHKTAYDHSLQGFWRKAEPEGLKYMSASAYYFAKALQEDLKVPVGIINCSWGGTRACCWMDRDSLQKHGAVWLEDYEKGFKEIPDPEAAEKSYFENPLTDPSKVFDDEIRNRLMKGATPEEIAEIFKSFGDTGFGVLIGPWHEWRPNGLYEYMLKPVMPYTIRGAIYYQGESDSPHADIYADILEDLIGLWRSGFKSNIPFIMTQLAPYSVEEGLIFPELREQQEKAAARIPDVWTASIGDVGNRFDIHPKAKRPVGERLALLARGHVYEENVLCEAPKGEALFRKGQTLVIRCTNAEGGLFQYGNGEIPVQVFRKDGTLLPNEAFQTEVSGDQIRIMLKEESGNTSYKVAFASTPYYEVNIFNMAGIPVKPFILEG